MTNLDWMNENGYSLDYVCVSRDEDAGRIILKRFEIVAPNQKIKRKYKISK